GARAAAWTSASEAVRRASGGTPGSGLGARQPRPVAPDLTMDVNVPMRIGLRQHGLDLGGGHHRQETHEQAEHREEEPEAPEQARDVPDRGAEVAPGRREEIAVQ